MDGTLQYILKLNDQLSPAMKSAASVTDSAAIRIAHDINKVESSTRTATGSVNKLKTELGQLGAQSKSGIGNGLEMIGKNLLIGAGAAMSIGLIKEMGQKAMDTTIKYQKMEAVLTNTLGSKSGALQSMEMIQKLASETPFQVDELTNSYVKLVNQGFQPTRKELISLGDIASSTGKGFDQLAEAILDAQTGEFERLKEFGIKGSKEKGGGMAFMFKGVKTGVDGSAASIRNYILSLGEAKGIMGSMSAISKTTGGQLSNMSDNVDMLWKAVGERLTPSINSGIGFMNSMIGSLTNWMKVPIEGKINNEIIKIQALQSELTSTNTKHDRQLEIYHELQSINPNLVKGINEQNIEYGKLAKNINDVTGALKQKIFIENFDKANASKVSAWSQASESYDKNFGNAISLIAQANPSLAQRTDLTLGQKQAMALKTLRDKIASGNVHEHNKFVISKEGEGKLVTTTEEGDMLHRLQASINQANKSNNTLKSLRPGIVELNKTKSVLGNQIDKILVGAPEIKNANKNNIINENHDVKQKSDNINSGGQRTITINIGKQIEKLEVHTMTMKEGVEEMGSMIREELKRVLYSVNSMEAA